MEVVRSKLDKDFDRYVLALDGIRKEELALTTPVLEPLDAVHTVRKAQWEARVHHNGLVADPFSAQTSSNRSKVAYFVDAEFNLMQVEVNQDQGMQMRKVFTLPKINERRENVTVQPAGAGVLVYCDGSGAILVLRSAQALSDAWEQVYECTPVGETALLLVSARMEDTSQTIRCLLAQPMEGEGKESAYRLYVLEISARKSSDSMDIDSGPVGLEHQVTEICVGAALPSFARFTGPELLMLLEGPSQVMVPVAANHSVGSHNGDQSHKRHHDDSDLDMSPDEVLSKLPRAGIGYHGDISDVKHPHELAAELEKPLEERFLKSSTPFSTLDEPLHSSSIGNAQDQRHHDGQESRLEMPTADSILGGFEECDDVDPNASAAILLYNCVQKVIQDRLEINCRNFRFLCASAVVDGCTDQSHALLFQHDVHGVTFELHFSHGQLSMKHTASIPAFGFVQASKQEKKFMAFTPSSSIAVIGEFEKRVFVYHGQCTPEQAQQHIRSQQVVELGDVSMSGLQILSEQCILVLTPGHVHMLTIS